MSWMQRGSKREVHALKLESSQAGNVKGWDAKGLGLALELTSSALKTLKSSANRRASQLEHSPFSQTYIRVSRIALHIPPKCHSPGRGQRRCCAMYRSFTFAAGKPHMRHRR